MAPSRDADRTWLFGRPSVPAARTKRMRIALRDVLAPRLRALGFVGGAGAGFRRLGARGVDCLTIQFERGRFRLDAGLVPKRRSLASRTFAQDWGVYADPHAKSAERSVLAGPAKGRWQDDWFVFERASTAKDFIRVAESAAGIVESLGEAFWSGAHHDRARMLAALARGATKVTPKAFARQIADAKLTIQEVYDDLVCGEGWSKRQRIAICQAVLTRPLPSRRHADERQAYIQVINDASVYASRLPDWKLALRIVEPHLALSKELDRFGHTAACALAKAGRAREALVQVERSLDADYSGCERMESDVDLDAIRKTPEFRALFAAWRNGKRKRARS